MRIKKNIIPLYIYTQKVVKFQRKRRKKMNKVWSETEKQFIKENASRLSDEMGAAKLSEIVARNITVHAYRKQRQCMGIRKKPGRGVCAVEMRDMGPLAAEVKIMEAAQEMCKKIEGEAHGL